MRARTLLIGSANPDKAAELRRLLAETDWNIVTLADLPDIPEPEETEDCFEGNALLKARYYAGHSELACVADDSGLEADALDGMPGVYSARYAGPDCTYNDNNRKLLDAMSNVENPRRTARFICCAAYADATGREAVRRGVVEGRIALECRGANGFGYDPLFIPDGHEATFAELPPADKSAISHRGRAFRAMADFLQSIV